MAVKIRLMRVGKKKQPSYRVVVADGRSPRDGRYIEIIGQYRPRQEPSFVVIDDEKALAWLRKGAQPTEQVQKLLAEIGVWEQYQTERGKAPGLAKQQARRTEPKLSKKARAKAEAASSTDEPAPQPTTDEPTATPDDGEAV